MAVDMKETFVTRSKTVRAFLNSLMGQFSTVTWKEGIYMGMECICGVMGDAMRGSGKKIG